MNHDIIGDLHGDADGLESLLYRLGYRNTAGAWRHPERQAIFVGDFIDRGPKQAATCAIVRRMVDAGTALAVMGNHEFNAVAWFTPDHTCPGQYLRRHTPSNRSQHRDFLDEYEGTAAHAEIIDWFMTLPLWIELDSIRVVHAQWHDASIAELAPRLGKGQTLTPSLLIESSHAGSHAFRTVEALLKGLEQPVTSGFTDKNGIVRHSRRVKWWESFNQDEAAGAGHDKPVFFGHYSLAGPAAPLAPKLACVDYYRPTDNPLVAYRWDGEEILGADKFVVV